MKAQRPGLRGSAALVAGLSHLFAPAIPIARNHRAGRARPPTARRVRARPHGVVLPVLQDGLDPAPGFFLLVAAHKQVQAACNHVEQQALVGAHALGAKALVKVQVQVHLRQRGLGLVLGGAAGNWVDRVFKEPQFFSGHVVDFISIPFNFPIFNIADIAIVGVAFLVVIRIMQGAPLGRAKSQDS